MNGVDFNRSGHVETSLFKAKGHPARTGKKIDCNWFHSVRMSNFPTFCKSFYREIRKKKDQAM